VFTQLPPGADMLTSGPKLENPVLLPAWRSAATAITPEQFAGAPTEVEELPAAATTATLATVNRLMAS
jgi:hypothetical protein